MFGCRFTIKDNFNYHTIIDGHLDEEEGKRFEWVDWYKFSSGVKGILVRDSENEFEEVAKILSMVWM